MTNDTIIFIFIFHTFLIKRQLKNQLFSCRQNNPKVKICKRFWRRRLLLEHETGTDVIFSCHPSFFPGTWPNGGEHTGATVWYWLVIWLLTVAKVVTFVSGWHGQSKSLFLKVLKQGTQKEKPSHCQGIKPHLASTRNRWFKYNIALMDGTYSVYPIFFFIYFYLLTGTLLESSLYIPFSSEQSECCQPLRFLCVCVNMCA